MFVYHVFHGQMKTKGKEAQRCNLYIKTNFREIKV